MVLGFNLQIIVTYLQVLEHIDNHKLVQSSW